jgi:hypothetical protein
VGGANEMEDVMNFNLNRNDLATKSAAQLAALFQDASRAITASNAAIASAQSLLAMIAQELGRRGSAPYTLEAELGITPNGIAEPDFQGWEVKQYGVRDFVRFLPKTPVTLMTPEPTGGVYREDGVASFLARFGYDDKNGRADRRNFGGIYAIGRDFHADTGLKLVMNGFDAASSKMTDLGGGMMLVDRNDIVAASWSFKDMMAHWNRKHAQAAYVPSLSRNPPPEYSYGAQILMCEQTDFILFLKAFAIGVIYYDPAIKIEKASSPKPEIKRRSQFRVNHKSLTNIYHTSETLLIT